MHRNRTFLLVSLTGSWALWCAPADAAVVSLKAVKVNDVPIEPTNFVTVQPGDIIETEIWLWGWSDRNRCASGSEFAGSQCETDADCGTGVCNLFLVDLYQVTMDAETGAASGDSGLLLPIGWPEDPSRGFYIDLNHPNYLFFGIGGTVIAAVDTSTLDYRLGGLVYDGPDGVADVGVAFYGGTVLLSPTTEYDDSGRACGVFTMPLALLSPRDVPLTYVVSDLVRLIVPTPEVLVVEVVCAPTAACCLLSTCYDLTEAECASERGIWHEYASCNDEAFECLARNARKPGTATRD